MPEPVAKLDDPVGAAEAAPAGASPSAPQASPDDRVAIRPIDDGPLVVSGLRECLRDSGERVPIDGTAYLCRCGGSGDKPFCDGSHNQNGFRATGGGEPAAGVPAAGSAADGVPAVGVAAGGVQGAIPGLTHGPTLAYRGQTVTVLDTRSACARAGFCVEFAPRVFSRSRDPWVDADASPPAHVARTIEMCPSGALGLEIERRRARFNSQVRPQLQVLRDGPYCVIGAAELDCALQPVDPTRFTLCRCGASANKPYCDGSHLRIGFKG